MFSHSKSQPVKRIAAREIRFTGVLCRLNVIAGLPETGDDNSILTDS
ncbi:hypothetical protein SAMN05216452_2052 [Nitratireductor aquibiodomus]|uniref:Uncharacterized protein n=1 Tax=Nitratireductor aquibiodomus TaxID=204799 RepID=A0A1H4K8X5_9HYPH|nr:hypothetical protein SAMN05216452_2052 [Nitratireductor aquibiodomus]